MPKIVKQYIYRNAEGKACYAVCRTEPKGFCQKTFSEFGDQEDEIFGRFDWGLACERLLYRLPELISEPGKEVYIVGGEKDADNLAELGYVTTTNSGGEAAKWVTAEGVLLPWVLPLKGRDIIIIPDNDEPGEKHAQHLLEILSPVSKSVRILRVPEGKDVSEFLERGHTKEGFELLRDSLDYSAVKEPEDDMPSAPHSEALILGAVLAGRLPFAEIDHLCATDFYDSSNQRIFVAAGEVYKAVASCEAAAIAQKLHDRGFLLEIGGTGRILDLCQDLPDHFDAQMHLETIQDRSEARRLIGCLEGAVARLKLNADTSTVMAEIEEAGKGSAISGVDIATLEDMIPDIESFLKPKPRGCMLESIGPFMDVFNGLDGSGKLICLAGLPGGGKSSLAGQIAGGLAAKYGFEAEVISLEIPWDDCLVKICCQMAKVPFIPFQSRQCSDTQTARVVDWVGKMRKSSLRISDSNSNWTIAKIRSHLKRRSKTKKPVKLLVIDYLQLMPTNLGRGGRLDVALNEITRSLKLMAQEFRLDIILLAQMTKESGKENREPEMRDLRDVSAADFDVVAFCHITEDDEDSPFRKVSLIVKKNRNGESNRRFPCLFVKPFTFFVDEQFTSFIEKIGPFLAEAASNC